MDGVFLGRQPILDRNKSLVAFELFFRIDEAAKAADVTDDVHATANVIVNAYGQLGIQNVLNQQRGFININAELLMSEIVLLLPAKYVVFELKAIAEFTDDIMKRCTELKQKGYQFALDGVTEFTADIEHVMPIINIIKINVGELEQAAVGQLMNEFQRWPVVMVAEKVETHDQANYCMELGFQMFQGYFFAQPEVIAGKRADPSKMSLLKLLTLVMGDSDIEDIEKEFKHQPGLSYNLMRMVNSVAGGLPQKINSIKHSIMVLGRAQLQRWIQLLLYTTDKNGDDMCNALMQTAAARGKLMELIAKVERPHDKNHQERAFMVGILSLLDVLLGIEMDQIIEKLGISDDMSQALLNRDGRLGQELQLVEANEKGEVALIQKVINDLGFMTLSELTDIELEAIGWANRLGEAAN